LLNEWQTLSALSEPLSIDVISAQDLPNTK